MKADVKIETEIMKILRRSFECYDKKDIDGMLDLFASDPDVVCIGTGKDEKRVGPKEIRAQFERDFSQCDSISCKLGWYMISAVGTVAWVAADYLVDVTINGQKSELTMRTSIVLEQRDQKWLIVHMHGSAPMQEQEAGESFPSK